jgi:hypothetical protein
MSQLSRFDAMSQRQADFHAHCVGEHYVVIDTRYILSGFVCA